MPEFFCYERIDDGEDRFVLQPRLEYGFARNWQATLTSSFFIGDADRSGSGDINLEALYNFNTESVYVPAFAVAAGVEFLTGKGTNGLDTTLKLIASKMPFPKSYLLHRLHFNALWKHNSGRKEGERRDLFCDVFYFGVWHTDIDIIPS